jgi:hypothetical protein
MAVGAYWDSQAAFNAGSAFIFRYMGGQWVQEQQILASDAAIVDYFGTSIDVRGTWIIVGANRDDADRGAAYIFVDPVGAPWVQQAKIVASDREPSDHFGWAVGIDGDWAVAGAPREDQAGLDAGAAYVFRRVQGSLWVQDQKLTASDAAPGDEFGESVAISGTRIVVGTDGTPGPASANAAYVFQYNGTDWVEQAILTGSAVDFGDRFGQDVAIDGDTVLVGAYNGDGPALNAGEAYVFTIVGTTWQEQAHLIASDGDNGDRFGWAVGIDGDRAAIGAWGVGDMAGAAYLFERVGTSWFERAKVAEAVPAPGDWLGYDVAISGTTLAAGALFDAQAGTGAGAAFTFDVQCTDCPDVDGDGVVDVVDLVELVLDWGPCPGCRSDLNLDGVVDVLDLVALVLGWGPC